MPAGILLLIPEKGVLPAFRSVYPLPCDVCFPEAGTETGCVMRGALGINTCGGLLQEAGLGRGAVSQVTLQARPQPAPLGVLESLWPIGVVAHLVRMAQSLFFCTSQWVGAAQQRQDFW